MILREAVYLDFAKQLQWPLTEVPVSLCFKKMVVLFNSAPSVSAGDAIHCERTNFGPYGCYRKRKNTNFSYKMLFPFSYTFKSGEKYDAILRNGSG